MAGIGFELKKLFSHKGLIFQLRANLYAGVVIAGPMLLGAALLLSMKFISDLAGADAKDQDALIVITTYSILFPLLITSLISFVLNRYLADLLYQQKYSRILPSMYGAISLCLAVGAVAWSIFLIVTRVPFEYAALSFMLFCEATAVWIMISYTNAVKDYVNVLLGFVYAILTTILLGVVFIWVLHIQVVTGMLAAACGGYGVMMVSYVIVIHKYFPVGKGSAFRFLLWVDKYPALMLVGFFSTIGLFGHIIAMWFSPWGTTAIAKFIHAPQHDIPALLAFLTTLVTTVNFVASVEVKFYKHYRVYFSLLNEGGSLSDIEKAYKEMATVLKQEIFYLAQAQLFITIIAIVIVGEVINNLGLGFTTVMVGLFRVLCVGYGLFAIGNTLMLFLLYLANFRAALSTAFALAFVNIVGTLFTITLPESYYGFGFVAAGLAMYLMGWWQLTRFIKKLDYHIYCKQPIFVSSKNSPLARLTEWLDAHNAT